MSSKAKRQPPTPPEPPPAPLSIRAYARRRGVSPNAVVRAIKSGRLRKSLVHVNGVAQIANPELADREWEANTDLTKAPTDVKQRAEARAAGVPPPAAAGTPDTPSDAPPMYDGVSLTEATTREKFWKAEMAELDYRERLGELIEVEEARRDLEAVAIAVKARLRRIPDAIADKLVAAAKKGPAVVKAVLLAEIDEALRELAAADPKAAAA